MSLNIKRLENLPHPSYPSDVYQMESENNNLSLMSGEENLNFESKESPKLILEKDQSPQEKKKKLLFRLNVI